MKVEKNEPFSYEGCDIDEIDKILLDENLIIDNFNSVKQKLEVFLKDGKEKIQIIADFDHTITALGDESNKTPTSYQTMIESPFLPTIVREQDAKLRNKYYAIEHNSKIPLHEKIPLMIEWWGKANSLIFDNKVTMEMIKNTILCRDVLIRNGVRKLFECSSSCKIPIIIVSAGLGDIVKGFIEKEIGHFENINYMANIFKFNEKGFVAGFQYEMIHSYNKNLYPTIMKKYIDDNRSRKNIILLGDMVSDLNIVENLRESFNILSLGFINEKYEERVINYSKSFDICINNPNELIITNLLLKLFSSV